MTTDDRVQVASADGTSLAVWVDGDGSPLVMVHGSVQDHRANDSFVDELRDHFTTWSMDRRGSGASGDHAQWSLEKEFEDVAAVVEVASEHHGAPVALWGHSFGAACAMGGAAMSRRISHLVLYEPSLGMAYPSGSIAAVAAAVATGDYERALHDTLTLMYELPDDIVRSMREQPTWASRVATAPTIVREHRAEERWAWEPGCFDGITAATLMIAGSDSPEELRSATQAAATAIGRPRVQVLQGHGHLAIRTDPALVASIVTDFVLG
jgi:pimeloyl-ACP methyl ester carboxylesterase